MANHYTSYDRTKYKLVLGTINLGKGGIFIFNRSFFLGLSSHFSCVK